MVEQSSYANGNWCEKTRKSLYSKNPIEREIAGNNGPFSQDDVIVETWLQHVLNCKICINITNRARREFRTRILGSS